jgi:hypothetical protein
MREKIKVLFLAADPFRDAARLELGEKMRAIDHAIQQGSAREGLELVAHFGTQTGDVQAALQRHRPQIVHFAGHGGRAGVIYLGDDRGGRAEVGKAALAKLFGALNGGVRVVVLNGCHTLPVATVLSKVVDYAIGTRDRISDEAAIQFADAFYTALAFGSGVRQAFDLAVARLMVQASPDAAVPALRAHVRADPAPLLSMLAVEAAAERADGGEVEQVAKLGRIAAKRANIIAADQQGGAPGPRRVKQVIEADSVGGGEFNLTGVRTGGRGQGVD